MKIFFFEFEKLEYFEGNENFDFFFFLKNLEILNFFKELKIWIFFWKKPKKYESNAPSPQAFFENFVFFFLKICSLSKKSEEDEDDDGVKVMKIYSWWFFFFFEKPILWMRITLAGSWCGLPDKSLLNSCKMIISISNGFIHWNELEVLTQCP